MLTLPKTNPKTLARGLGYVLETRRYGHTYIHSAFREEANPLSKTHKRHEYDINGRTAVLLFAGYGRSLQAGGHKYKAWLIWEDTRKPVPSKLLTEAVAL